MTPREFDIKYWQNNNPITTPIWKCSQAYAEYYHTEQLRLHVVSGSCPTCGEELVYGLSEETMKLFKNSKLFKGN